MIYLVNNIIKYIIIFLRDFLNLWIRFLVYFGVDSVLLFWVCLILVAHPEAESMSKV